VCQVLENDTLFTSKWYSYNQTV